MASRVQSEPATSAAPETRATAPIATAEEERTEGSADRQHTACVHESFRLSQLQRLRAEAHAPLHSPFHGECTHGSPHSHPPRRRRLLNRCGDHRQTPGGCGGGAREHKWELPSRSMPRRGSGVGEQHTGVRGERRRQHGRQQTGRPGAGPEETTGDRQRAWQHRGDLPGRRSAGKRSVGREDPGAHRHRRGRFGGSQHIQETHGFSEVVDERGGPGRDTGDRAEARHPAQLREIAQVRPGREQRAAGRQPTEEHVGGDVNLPRRGLDDRTAVVRRECGRRHHRPFAFTAPTSTPAAPAGGRRGR